MSTQQVLGTPFLFDSVTGRVVGVKHPDGTESSLLMADPSGALDAAAAAAMRASGNPVALRDGQDFMQFCAAYSSASYTGPRMYMRLDSTKTYNLTAATEINLSKIGGDGCGATIDCSGLAEPALKLTVRAPDTSNRWAHDASTLGLQNMVFIGPGKGVTGCYLVEMDNPYSINGVTPTLRNFEFRFAEKALNLKNHVYLLTLENPHFYLCRVGLHVNSATDSGENIRIIKGVTDGVDLSFLLDNPSEINVDTHSFDYSKQIVVMRAGASLKLTNPHIEPRGKNLAQDPGNYVLDGSGVDSRAYIAGRDSYIDIDNAGSKFLMEGGSFYPNSSGGSFPYGWNHLVNVRHKLCSAHFRDVDIGTTLNSNELFATGPGDFQKNGITTTIGGVRTLPGRWHDDPRANRLVDGGIEDGTFPDMWTIFRDGSNQITTSGAITDRFTGTNGSISRSTTLFYAGASSLKVSKLTTGAGTNFQAGVMVPVRQGDRLNFFCRVNNPSTGGMGGTDAVYISMRYAKLKGYTSAGVPIIARLGNECASAQFVPGSMTKDTWLTFVCDAYANNAAGETNAPAWADVLTVQFYIGGSTTTVGSFYVDDVFLT